MHPPPYTQFCLAALFLAAEGVVRGEPGGAESPQVAVLLTQLGHPVFARRDAASKQLEALGEPILPALRQTAATSDDLEVRKRAQQIIRRIMLAACKSRATGMELALIDAGVFSMGSPAGEGNRKPDEDSHHVRLTRAVVMGRYEVTQAEYLRVMKHNPSWFAESGEGKLKVANMETSRFPVERVSWYDAAEFCNRLSRLDGLAAYYQLDDVKREEDSIASATVAVLGGSGYRLPTEAEWEYACRAGTVTPFHFGSANSGREANLKAYTGGGYGGPVTLVELARSARVGSYPANAAGLADMHANVGEWCGDWYDKDYYAKSPPDDPPGPAAGIHRVVRGGSWLVNEATCRSASRYWLTPGDRNNYTGFRICRSL